MHQIAERVTDLLYAHAFLNQEKRATYVYGVELALSTLFSCCSILVISLFLGDVCIGILFLLSFISIRTFAGGFHAKTYFRCFVISNLIFVISFLFISILCNISISICFLLFLISGCIIVPFSPISSPHHPISSSSQKRNQMITRLIFFIEIGCSIVLYLIVWSPVVLSSVAVSFFAVALLMLFSLLSNKKSSRKGGVST